MVWLLAGCVTNKDLETLRTDIGQQLVMTKEELAKRTRENQEKIAALDQSLQTVHTQLQQLSARQQTELSAVRKDVDTALTQLDEHRATLTKVRQELERVRTDLALLKPLGIALENVQARLDTTHSLVNALKAETESQRETIAQLGEEVQDVRAAQEAIQQETEHVKAVVEEIGAELVQRLRLELNYARERLHQLEQVLNRFPKKERAGEPKAIHGPSS